jgi:hypothetical protein
MVEKFGADAYGKKDAINMEFVNEHVVRIYDSWLDNESNGRRLHLMTSDLGNLLNTCNQPNELWEKAAGVEMEEINNLYAIYRRIHRTVREAISYAEASGFLLFSEVTDGYVWHPSEMLEEEPDLYWRYNTYEGQLSVLTSDGTITESSAIEILKDWDFPEMS